MQGAGSAPPSIADANVISGSSALAEGHRPRLTGRGPALADVLSYPAPRHWPTGTGPGYPARVGALAGVRPDGCLIAAGSGPDCAGTAAGFRAGRPPGLQAGLPPDCGRRDSRPGYRRILDRAAAGIPDRAAAGIPDRAA